MCAHQAWVSPLYLIVYVQLYNFNVHTTFSFTTHVNMLSCAEQKCENWCGSYFVGKIYYLDMNSVPKGKEV